jgi:integrase
MLDKTPNQLRKWKNPRKRAMRNFIARIGNKPLHELIREDILRYRDWWINRLQDEDVVSNTANKELVFVKTIISTVAENLNLNLNLSHIFKKLLIKRDDSRKRLPFTSEYIVDTFLNPKNLKGLNDQARWVLYAFSETGAGLNELTGLLPEDIFLDEEIPYIHIRRRKGRSLKTKFRERKIPLVGFAMDAFKACPNGFTDYNDRPDSLSGLLSKYLHEHKLLPSDQHTVYSLRHSFQDRLLAENSPDRVQADLMGHKFQRPSYGEGATLAHKLNWLQKIQLK